MSYNKAILIGNVGKDPEIRYLGTNNTQKVATLSVATSEKYKDRNGEQKGFTEWHNVVCFGGPADYCEKYVKKGQQVFCEGKIRTRSWTDQYGQKKVSTDIITDNIQILDKKESTQQRSAVSTPAPTSSAIAAAKTLETQTQGINTPEDDDDLPF